MAFRLRLLRPVLGPQVPALAVTVTPIIAVVVAVTITEPPLIAAVLAFVTVSLIGTGLARLLMLRLVLCAERVMRQALLEPFVEDILPVVLAKVIAAIPAGMQPAHSLTVAVGLVAVCGQLITVGHDDATVVLGVLEIVLRQHRITR